MAKKRNKQEDEQQGAPEWMVTFSDCMTLLLTFFVLLLSFSSFDSERIKRINGSFTAHMSSLNRSIKTNKTFLFKKETIKKPPKLEKGSERPTDIREKQNDLLKTLIIDDCDKHKVFVKLSGDFFWAQGLVISREGTESLKALADFFKEKKGRIVVCETNPKNKTDDLGIKRSMKIIEYFSDKEGLDRNLFNLSLRSLVPAEILPEKNNRFVQIVMLEKKLYK